MIRKIAIRNYRMFRKLDLEFSPNINILVGKNDTGKSTLLEAINLALTGRVHGRFFSQELNPYFINFEATQEYIEKLNSGKPPTPPMILIDLFFDANDQTEILRGSNNIDGDDSCGVRIQAAFSTDFSEEYDNFVKEVHGVHLIPTEYYKVEWLSFSGNPISSRNLPLSSMVIDPTTLNLQSGVDFHLQEIIRTHLEPKDRVELSREYRSLREEFNNKDSVKSINEQLKNNGGNLTDRSLSLAIDISQRYTWESSVIAHLDDLPLHMVGKGDQNTLKTLLAIGRKVEDTQIVLLEEPENHLSFSSMWKLLSKIEERCTGKQLIVATHSNFVLNKLGLNNLILMGNGISTRITDLPKGTVEYFKKLAGFDTLRLVLSDRAILVEGPSDELIVQRAYMDFHGKLPIENGIEVISVGLAHKRFLDLAIRLNRRVWIVTDNDGKTLEQVKTRFEGYLDHANISLHVGNDPKLKTLEPQIVAINELEKLNSIFDTKFNSTEELITYMTEEKTSSALAVFESKTKINMPDYITDVTNK